MRVQGVSKVFPGGVRALNQVTFDVHPGEFLVVIGLSGSGKTTLLRCMNHLHEPSSGTVLFKNRPLLEIDPAIAMIFQQFNLIGRHSVLRNVLMGRLHATPVWKSLLGIFSQKDHEQAVKFLNLVGIGSHAHMRAQQLSGGQQQRVAIARALAQNPELLLADEPVASLDPATCHVVMDYLRKLNRELGITVVCNLHFLSLVREYATRVLALRAGELVFEGTPQEIDPSWFRRIYGEGAKDIRVE